MLVKSDYDYNGITRNNTVNFLANKLYKCTENETWSKFSKIVTKQTNTEIFLRDFRISPEKI